MNPNRLWTVLVLIVVTGCHRHGHGVASVPPPAPPVAAAPVLPAVLTDAEALFESGDFLKAAVSYDFYFQSRPQSNDLDRIRFRYGVAQSLSGVADLETASTDTFKLLIRDFPNSPYVPPARMAIELQGNIARLQTDKAQRDERIRQLNALIPAPPPVLPAALADAEAAFDKGDFSGAAGSYESYLQSKPQAPDMDGILFRFGVAQLLSGVPARETASNDTFKQLIKEYSNSNSPYALSAGRILALRDKQVKAQQSELKSKDETIHQLKDELDILKKADSGRRRTP
jgi:outer membrane protein assembly factor BamD (BamD/ComL family)